MNLDYQRCLQDGQTISCEEKVLICPNYRYVFHAEFELQLNSFFPNPTERWYLVFQEIIPLVPFNDIQSNSTVQCVHNKYYISHNAKIKYCCRNCAKEWTSARGRILFLINLPLFIPCNILYVNVCSQRCQLCGYEVFPSCYLDEATRVMKETCRLILQTFYFYRFPQLEPVENSEQRVSHMRGHHQRHLCQACQKGTCLNYRRRQF